ncbi:MAG: SLBB domain-containing protein [Flavobacteriaceae bacterium]
MRKLLFGLFSLLFLSVSAQQLPSGVSASNAAQTAKAASKEQLQSYVKRAKEEGYTLTQVKSIIRAQGASLSDVALLEELWNAEDSDVEENIADENQINSNFGLFGVEEKEEDENMESLFTIKRFGSDYFSAAREGETPELYLATPSDYQLGPGDEILVELYGASEESYELQISREGTIKVERLAPVYLSGLSIAAAKRRLEARFSEIYTGLKAGSNDPSKVTLSISLQKARSVVVNITGQVVAPGTYTLSGFTSVLNALYAAGGPNAVGSYRKVRLVRGGRLYKEIDLYDFFVSGKMPSIYLQDQDVLLVPAFNSQVELSGDFKTPGYFELKKNETLSDVLDYSGGFLSDAYKERVFVNRVTGFKRQSFTLETVKGSSELLQDGDVLTANLVRETLENSVSIEGEVYVPGTYSLESVTTLEELLAAANGINISALPTRATLFRSNYGVENSALSIDLTNSSVLSIALKNGDRLFVPSVENLTDYGQIEVQGQVNSPGSFEFKKGMSLSDALILAEGFTATANGAAVTIYHSELSDESTTTTTTIVAVDENLVPENNTELSANDLIVVRQIPGFKTIEKVTLEGFVKNQGVYALKGSDYRLYDLLQESGGFLQDAYLPGISITRKVLSQGTNQRAIKKAVEDAAESTAGDVSEEDLEKAEEEQLEELESESVIIGIDGEKLMSSRGMDSRNNIVLKEGDIITVPKLDNTITVLGEIQQSTKVTYRSGLTVKGAIRAAGGLSDKARASRVYVVYQNGAIKSRRSAGFGIIRLDPKLEPGATVVVPEKLPRENGTSLGDIVGVTSSLATLALLIRQLGI